MPSSLGTSTSKDSPPDITSPPPFLREEQLIAALKSYPLSNALRQVISTKASKFTPPTTPSEPHPTARTSNANNYNNDDISPDDEDLPQSNEHIDPHNNTDSIENIDNIYNTKVNTLMCNLGLKD
jgi:hypothetical protein